MNEIIAGCIGFVLGAATVWFALYQQIRYLQARNGDLLGSLYHRIGYKPVIDKVPVKGGDTLSDEPRVAPQELTLLELQEKARSED